MTYEIPPEAERLHAEGRAAGARGDYENALALLARASELAPEWPYPPYDAAFTLLLAGDTRGAQAMYERVEALSPRGFFTCRTTLDMLRREHAGWLFPGFSRAFMTLEWMSDPVEKKQILVGITRQFPDFPPAWLELASLAGDPNERMNALDRGLEGAPDPDTKTTLLLNKAGLYAANGDLASAARVYQMLIDDPEVTPTGEAFARAFLEKQEKQAPPRR